MARTPLAAFALFVAALPAPAQVDKPAAPPVVKLPAEVKVQVGRVCWLTAETTAKRVTWRVLTPGLEQVDPARLKNALEMGCIAGVPGTYLVEAAAASADGEVFFAPCAVVVSAGPPAPTPPGPAPVPPGPAPVPPAPVPPPPQPPPAPPADPLAADLAKLYAAGPANDRWKRRLADVYRSGAEIVLEDKGKGDAATYKTVSDLFRDLRDAAGFALRPDPAKPAEVPLQTIRKRLSDEHAKFFPTGTQMDDETRTRAAAHFQRCADALDGIPGSR